MITGALKSKVDQIWDASWSGGISNPLTVIEQITYLLFIRRLDDLETLAEKRANLTGEPMQRRLFGADQQDLRWSRFKDTSPDQLFATVSERVFPWLRSLGTQADNSTTYTAQMESAYFAIPTPALLSKVVDLLADIPMTNTDTNGDLYEYLLSKLNTAGVMGQFRTPRHIINLMVDMTAPKWNDIICDPACGTAGF